MSREYKVFGYAWHVGHQHELAKLSFIEQYDLLINPYRDWGTSSRPVPENVNFVPEYVKGKYDFAILHLDQQCIYNPDKGDRISKGRIYKEVNELIQDIPKIVINHMTPFHDKYSNQYVVKRMKEMVGDNYMIVNTYEAEKQWGWGHPVIHGMTPNEWWDIKPKEPRVITTLSPAGMEKAYRRTFLHAVIRQLKEMDVPFHWIMNDTKFSTFDEYREFIGRSLVYFNPTWQSPRPRSRTEAMFSGCALVTTPYQDAHTFVNDGENGFLTSEKPYKDPRAMDNPEYTAKILKRLIDDPEMAHEMGQKAKQTAMELFTFDKFEEQWVGVLEEVG